MDTFGRTLFEEIMPRVETSFRASKDPHLRALAGLSMGGAQTLYLGLNNPDKFAWIGAFSSAIIMYGADYSKWFPSIGVAENRKLALLEVDCGTTDFLLKANEKFREFLKSAGVQCSATALPGGHTWNVWRRNLTRFLPKLFGAGR